MCSRFNLSISFAIISFVAVTLFAGPNVDPDIWQLLDQLRPERTQPADIERVRNALIAIPDWEERLGKTLADLAIEGRYNGNISSLKSEMEKYWDGNQLRPLTPDELKRYEEVGNALFVESGKETATGKSKSEIYRILERLKKLNSPRAVALMAPLLAERGTRIDYGDSSVPAVQQRALDALVDMERYGFNPPDSPGGPVLEAWRQWWVKVRKDYEPIPSALAALEATQGGTVEPPATLPAAVPPPKPRPTATPAPVPTPEPPAKPNQTPPTRKTPYPWLIAAAVLAIASFGLIYSRRR